jgi:hypothetical protein
LKELNYIIFSNNDSIFYHQLNKLIIIIYIYDIYYMGEILNEIKKLKELLAKIFKISNLGDSKIYFEINIDYNQSQQICYFS